MNKQRCKKLRNYLSSLEWSIFEMTSYDIKKMLLKGFLYSILALIACIALPKVVFIIIHFFIYGDLISDIPRVLPNKGQIMRLWIFAFMMSMLSQYLIKRHDIIELRELTLHIKPSINEPKEHGTDARKCSSPSSRLSRRS